MAEVAGNLIEKKFPNNIKEVWKTSQQKKIESKTGIPNKRCIFRKEGRHIIDKLRLI